MLWKMENELCAAGEEEEKPVCLASPLLQGLIHSKHPNPFQPFSIHLKSKHLNPSQSISIHFQSISIYFKASQSIPKENLLEALKQGQGGSPGRRRVIGIQIYYFLTGPKPKTLKSNKSDSFKSGQWPKDIVNCPWVFGPQTT